MRLPVRVYLDFFLHRPCYSEVHDEHLPGGGNWMNRKRVEQLDGLKAALATLSPPPADFLFSIEGAFARFTGDVHVMHTDPAGERRDHRTHSVDFRDVRPHADRERGRRVMVGLPPIVSAPADRRARR